MLRANAVALLAVLALLTAGGASTQSARAVHEFERALLFERAGNGDSARAAYMRALAADSVSVAGELAPARLEALLKAEAAPPPKPFLAAERLAEIGRDEAALAALEAAIREHPDEEVPTNLHFLSGGKVERLREARRWVARREALFELLLGVLAVLGVIAALLFRRWAEPQLEIGEFEATGPEAGVGSGFAALVADDLKRLSRGAGARAGSARTIEVVRGPIEPISIPATVAALIPGSLSWMKAAPALLQWLSLRPRLSLSGTLHRLPRRGAGVTLVLLRNGRAVAGETLWESHFAAMVEPAEPGGAAADRSAWLVEPAATWLLYHLPLAHHPGDASKHELRLLGASDWRSYALFRAGLRYEEDGNPDAARRMYERALSRDAGNRGARTNLAALFMERGENQRAIEELHRVIGTDPLTADLADPVTYSALYRLASAEYHSGSHADAQATAVTLMRRIRRAQRHATPGDADLRSYLESIEPSSLVLAIGTAAHQAATLGGLQRLAQRLAAVDTLSADAVVQYNLAVTYWVMAEHQHAEPSGWADWIEAVFLHLRRAFELGRPLARWAPKDPSLAGLFRDRGLGPRAWKLVAAHDPTAAAEAAGHGPAAALRSVARWLFGDPAEAGAGSS